MVKLLYEEKCLLKIFCKNQKSYNGGRVMKICELNNNFFMDDKGVLREKTVYSDEQEQTKDTFSYKWSQKNSYSGKK